MVDSHIAAYAILNPSCRLMREPSVRAGDGNGEGKATTERHLFVRVSMHLGRSCSLPKPFEVINVGKVQQLIAVDVMRSAPCISDHSDLRKHSAAKSFTRCRGQKCNIDGRMLDLLVGWDRQCTSTSVLRRIVPLRLLLFFKAFRTWSNFLKAGCRPQEICPPC